METETDIIEGGDILATIKLNKGGVNGLLWDKIAEFRKEIQGMEGAIESHTEEMAEQLPLKHNFEGGLYTREIFVPKDSIMVSYIHKQDHPSFMLKGRASILQDNGEVKEITAPCTIFTKVGTQRVFYVHEDTVFVCVYKTDKTTVEEAEKEIYTLDYRELPDELIQKRIES